MSDMVFVDALVTDDISACTFLMQQTDVKYKTAMQIGLLEQRSFNKLFEKHVSRGSKNAKVRPSKVASQESWCTDGVRARAAEKKYREVARSHERDMKRTCIDVLTVEAVSANIEYQCVMMERKNVNWEEEEEYNGADGMPSSLRDTQSQHVSIEPMSVDACPTGAVSSPEWQLSARGKKGQSCKARNVVVATVASCVGRTTCITTDVDVDIMDLASLLITHIVAQPLLWESDELTENLAKLANEYQQISDDRYFMDYLDDKAHGNGLALLTAVVLWKGQSFFHTKENARNIQAVQDSGLSNWRVQRTRIVREWTRHVRGVVNDYLDNIEKLEQKQICRLRPKSEWKELEANTLRNLMDTTTPLLKQDNGRVLKRRELSFSLRQEGDQKMRLHPVQSAPVSQGFACEAPNLRSVSAPHVFFSDHVEVIEPNMELHTEEQSYAAEKKITRW